MYSSHSSSTKKLNVFDVVLQLWQGLRTTVNKHVQGNLTSHLDDMAKGHADLVGTVAELSRRVSEVEEQLQEEALAENVRNLSLG